MTVSGANITNPLAGIRRRSHCFVSQLFRELACTPTTFHFSPVGTYVTSTTGQLQPVYMNQWNLSIQRQVGKDWLVTANYVGNSTIHMISGEDINPAVFLGLGPCTHPDRRRGRRHYTVCSTTANQQKRRVLYSPESVQGQYYSKSEPSTTAAPANTRVCIYPPRSG